MKDEIYSSLTSQVCFSKKLFHNHIHNMIVSLKCGVKVVSLTYSLLHLHQLRLKNSAEPSGLSTYNLGSNPHGSNLK